MGLSLVGSGNYLTLAGCRVRPPGVTIMCWFRPASTSGWGYTAILGIAPTGGGGDSRYIGFGQIDSDRTRVYFDHYVSGTWAEWLSPTGTLSTTRWTHLCHIVRWDGAGNRRSIHMIDGVVANETVHSFDPAGSDSDPVVVGLLAGDPSNGAVAFVRAWARPLSPAEVRRAMWQDELHGTLETGLRVDLPFHRDRLGRGGPGTLTGTATWTDNPRGPRSHSAPLARLWVPGGWWDTETIYTAGLSGTVGTSGSVARGTTRPLTGSVTPGGGGGQGAGPGPHRRADVRWDVASCHGPHADRHTGVGGHVAPHHGPGRVGRREHRWERCARSVETVVRVARVVRAARPCHGPHADRHTGVRRAGCPQPGPDVDRRSRVVRDARPCHGPHARRDADGCGCDVEDPGPHR